MIFLGVYIIALSHKPFLKQDVFNTDGITFNAFDSHIIGTILLLWNDNFFPFDIIF